MPEIWNEDLKRHVEKIHQLEQEAIKMNNPLTDLNQWRVGSKALKKLAKEFKEEQRHQRELKKRREQTKVILFTAGGSGSFLMMGGVIVGI